MDGLSRSCHGPTQFKGSHAEQYCACIPEVSKTEQPHCRMLWPAQPRCQNGREATSVLPEHPSGARWVEIFSEICVRMAFGLDAIGHLGYLEASA